MTGAYDVVVVGAGIEGSATAYTSAKNGYRTLLIEQFPLPHIRGSSHGHGRITRKAYFEDYFAAMMIEAFDLWALLEKEAQDTFFIKSGVLVASDGHCKIVDNSERSLKQVGCVHERLDGAALRQRMPALTYSHNATAVLDHEGGVLRADVALRAYQKMFCQYGGLIKDGEKVTSIVPGDTVTVNTSGASYSTRSVVITAGPWTSKLLRPLGLSPPLQPVRISVCYWKTKTPSLHSADKFPCVIDTEGTTLYALPLLEYPDLIKVCRHDGPPIDPDDRDTKISVTESEKDIEYVAQYIRKRMPGVEDKPSIVETCIYTQTPDESFILDRHPAWKNVIIGAGFSGHGFKLAPVVGKVLSELATGRPPSYDMSPFKLSRFSNVSTPNSKL